MANFTSISTILDGSPSPYGKGTTTILEATYPASQSSANLPAVGNLSADDLVEVVPVESVASYVMPMEVKASRTTSNVGVGALVVKFVDASTSPAATCKMQIRIFRNT